jgi:hypothetical protein
MPNSDTGWYIALLLNAASIAALIIGVAMGDMPQGISTAVVLLLFAMLAIKGLKPPF